MPRNTCDVALPPEASALRRLVQLTQLNASGFANTNDVWKAVAAELARNIAADEVAAMAFGRWLKRNPLQLGCGTEVYFIGHNDGPIKIGFAQSPNRRLIDLQIAHSQELHIWSRMPGTSLTEHFLHDVFAGSWIRGEWFERTPALVALMTEVDDTPKLFGRANCQDWRTSSDNDDV